jgi:hypothetical protein
MAMGVDRVALAFKLGMSGEITAPDPMRAPHLAARRGKRA